MNAQTKKNAQLGTASHLAERWIHLRGLGMTFAPAVHVLNKVDLDVPKGQIVCIVGPSGCGKTTLLNLLAGFTQPTKGICQVAGETTSAPGPQRGFVFQRPALFPWMNVWDNVTIGPRVQGHKQSEWKEKADHLLEETGLSKLKSHFPYQISGGQQQRVQLVRVMMNEPSVVLMDEPFGALDYMTRLTMHQLLLKLHAEYEPTILFITHDVDEAVFLADRVLVMKSAPGEIIRDIPIDIERPRTVHQYSTPEFGRYKEEILELLGFH